jgi:hypothetical protein
MSPPFLAREGRRIGTWGRVIRRSIGAGRAWPGRTGLVFEEEKKIEEAGKTQAFAIFRPFERRAPLFLGTPPLLPQAQQVGYVLHPPLLGCLRHLVCLQPVMERA